MESINKTPEFFYEVKESDFLYGLDENQQRTKKEGWAARIKTQTQLSVDVWGHFMEREEVEQVTKVLCASYEILEALENLVNSSEHPVIHKSILEDAKELIFRIKNG